MTPSNKEVKKKTEVNVQGQIKLLLILDKSPREKICVDLIGPYNTHEI